MDVHMNKNKTTFADRFAASFIMMIASSLTAMVIWVFVFFIVGRAGEIFIFPFIYVFYATAAFTILAFVSPNISLRCMGWIWGKMDKFIKALMKDDSGAI